MPNTELISLTKYNGTSITLNASMGQSRELAVSQVQETNLENHFRDAVLSAAKVASVESPVMTAETNTSVIPDANIITNEDNYVNKTINSEVDPIVSPVTDSTVTMESQAPVSNIPSINMDNTINENVSVESTPVIATEDSTIIPTPINIDTQNRINTPGDSENTMPETPVIESPTSVIPDLNQSVIESPLNHQSIEEDAQPVMPDLISMTVPVMDSPMNIESSVPESNADELMTEITNINNEIDIKIAELNKERSTRINECLKKNE